MDKIAKFFKHLPEIVSIHVVRYMDELAQIKLTEAAQMPRVSSMFKLSDSSVTAIMALGGEVQVMVAFNFSGRLMERIKDRAIAGLDIPEEEQDIMLHEAAAEVINIVLGHAMNDMDKLGETIHLSPPIVISEGKQLHQPKKACFAEASFGTEDGILRVLYIGPAELFDTNLNAKTDGEE